MGIVRSGPAGGIAVGGSTPGRRHNCIWHAGFPLLWQRLSSLLAHRSPCFCRQPDARAADSSGACADAAGLAVLASPVAPWKGAPLRVIFTAEKPFDGEFSLIAPDGSVAAASRDRHGGPPYFWFAEVASPAAGTWHATLARGDAPAECGTDHPRHCRAATASRRRPAAQAGSVWPVRNSWNRATENLYSAWIEKLFDAPLDAEPSWTALHEVLRDQSRNVLFNYLGLGEDEMGLVMPSRLRRPSVFPARLFRLQDGAAVRLLELLARRRRPAAEMLHGSSRPESRRRARLAVRATKAACRGRSQVPRLRAKHSVWASFVQSTVADAVHSGTGRTAAADDNTDFYPVPLTQEALRPGTVYADPYGHVLMLVSACRSRAAPPACFSPSTRSRTARWRASVSGAATSCSRRIPRSAGPGFKRFRPIVREGNGALRRLTNAEIAKNPQYGDFSLEQSKLGVEDFYDRMDDVMSPAPLDPLRAMKEAITSLEEQVKARVTAVENGRKFQTSGHGEATMPDGAAIFATTGAWEDFSTPARDFRLLIAIDVVRGFPGSRRAPARALRDAEGQERRRREGRAGKRARLRARGAQVFLYAQRRLTLDALAQGRDRPLRRVRDGVQPQRLRRVALGRARQERRSRRPASGMRRGRSAPR